MEDNRKNKKNIGEAIDEFVRQVGKDVEKIFEGVKESDIRSSVRKAASVSKGKAVFFPVKPGESIYIVKDGKMEEKVVREVICTLRGTAANFEYVYEAETDLPKGGHYANAKTESIEEEHVYVTLEDAFDEYRKQQSARDNKDDQNDESSQEL